MPIISVVFQIFTRHVLLHNKLSGPRQVTYTHHNETNAEIIGKFAHYFSNPNRSSALCRVFKTSQARAVFSQYQSSYKSVTGQL